MRRIRRPVAVTMLSLAAISSMLGGCSLFGGRGNRAKAVPDLAASKVTTIGVNAYLWARQPGRAVVPLPLVQTDSNGGGSSPTGM